MSTRERPPLEGSLGRYLGEEGLDAQGEERVWAKVRARRARLRGDGVASGSALPSPIGPTLLAADGLGKSRAQLWREVRARVHHPEKHRPLRLLLASMALVAVATACAMFAVTFRWSTFAGRAAKAPLVMADGRPLAIVDSDKKPLTVRLTDASEIRLSPDSRVEPLSSSGSRFEVLLARGSAEFSVTPGGPRRWLVEAGAARVEVVGTVFRVTRSDGAVHVSVSRGSVLVRGANVAGWVQRLNAGEQLTARGKEVAGATLQQVEARGRADAPSTASPPAAPASTPSSPAPPLQKSAASSARAAAARHRAAPLAAASSSGVMTPAERYAALGASGVLRETARATSIDQLLELADVARLSGHPQDAVAPLTRVLDAFQGSRQAALAAFTLGRVLLDQLDRPEAAAAAFERALVLGLPRGLRADCYRRLAEAYDRDGNRTESMRAEDRLRGESDEAVRPERRDWP